MSDAVTKPTAGAIPALEVPPRARPSSYPPVFAARVAGRVKRPLGDLFGLRNVGVNLTCLKPGAASALHHRHSRQDELIYVLEGEVEQWVEREVRVLRPGEVAHIPRAMVHATYNAGKQDAVILAILSPASCAGPFAVDVSGEEPWKSLRPVSGH